MSYLLSIVVPTKDRYKYLKHLISFIDGFNTEEIELIIQDNTSNNTDILEFINSRQRLHLKYFHQKEQIPVYLNADLAILHSTGEYVCFIGDDDGVLPTILDCVKWMKMNNIEALRPAVTIYNWPDFLGFGKRNLSGALFYNDFSFDAEEINIVESLKKLANRGFSHIYTIPKVYQGIVKRTCLDEIYKIGQTFSPGPSPDMATAVALSFVIKKFVSINLPVIIIGQCQTVGGGERKLKGGVMNIEDVPFLPNNAKVNWTNRIPKVWCSHTVWPESAIKAIQYMNQKVEINYECILAKFICSHKSEMRLALKLSENKVKLFYYLIIFTVTRFLISIYRIIIGLVKGVKRGEGRNNTISDLNNVKEASDCLMREYPNYTNAEAFNNLKFFNSVRFL